MSTYRAALSFPMDTALPKDAVSINPHFNGSDAQALANALGANIESTVALAAAPYTVKIYDAAAAPPSYPLATHSKSGTPPASAAPREVCLCVSYYSGYNRPRYRGRLFLPASWLTSVVNVRPTTTHQNAAITLFKALFGAGLPAQTNLVVWSQVEKKSMGGVNNLWVDDEWDTQRKRGLSPTARVTATFP
jgi:hypothetical protein